MNRRSFIRGFVGLAALAVVGPSLATLPKTDRERLVAQMRDGGLIENQTFLLSADESAEFQQVRNLTIRNCKFIRRAASNKPLMVIGKGCDGLVFENCAMQGYVTAINGTWRNEFYVGRIEVLA